MSAREWTDAEAQAAFNEHNRNMPHTADGITVGLIGRALLTLRHERNEARKERDEVRAENAVLMERNRLLQSCVDDNSQAIIAAREQRVRAERERDLLAAECRASRADEDGPSPLDRTPEAEHLRSVLGATVIATRRAVDAAGVLGREE